MFVGVLSKDDKWIKKTIEETLPKLEARTLELAKKCRESGECAEDDPLCDEDRIKELFKKTEAKLKEEHEVRKSRTRFHHL